jgi:hypothetical protein
VDVIFCNESDESETREIISMRVSVLLVGLLLSGLALAKQSDSMMKIISATVLNEQKELSVLNKQCAKVSALDYRMGVYQRPSNASMQKRRLFKSASCNKAKRLSQLIQKQLLVYGVLLKQKNEESTDNLKGN